MGATAKVPGPMTVEEFLNWDSGDDFVWELIDGYPRLKFPPNPGFMGHAAPSDNHQVLIQNLGALISQAIRAKSRPCRVVPGPGQKVSRKRERVRIPDLAIKCGRSRHDAQDPILIAEVISPSNTGPELAERDADFRSIATVQEMLIVEQDRPVVTRHRRIGDLWRVDRFEGLDASVGLESVALEIPLLELYRDVLDREAPDGPGDAG